MQIEILDKAIKDLQKIDKLQANKILESICKLENYPNISNIKKLINHNPTYRLRVGNYRVLFDISDDIVVIGRIRHRKDVY
jgi:mRNA interferase RelE/StbE